MSDIKLAIIIPLFNDWESLNKLIPKIDHALKHEALQTELIIVNDASIEESTVDVEHFKNLEKITKIDIIHLNCNMGHQRAIAIGLSEVFNRKTIDAVVVMDSDGEDRPEDIPSLIHQFRKEKDNIIVAHRGKRSEGRVFQIGYYIYRFIFRVLTGKAITFGNFCLIPIKLLNRLIYRDSLWNHLPATILKSRLPISMVSTTRGARLKGKSHMNLSELVLHGLSAVSVYSETALLRTFSLSLIFGFITVSGIVTVTIVRLFTELAIPGWASNVVGSLTIMLILSLVISIFVLFIILTNRSQLTIIPAKHISDYIQKIETVFQK
jgi:glycosyltransferase involved in cell wall biosynthesis